MAQENHDLCAYDNAIRDYEWSYSEEVPNPQKRSFSVKQNLLLELWKSRCKKDDHEYLISNDGVISFLKRDSSNGFRISPDFNLENVTLVFQFQRMRFGVRLSETEVFWYTLRREILPDIYSSRCTNPEYEKIVDMRFCSGTSWGTSPVCGIDKDGIYHFDVLLSYILEEKYHKHKGHCDDVINITGVKYRYERRANEWIEGDSLQVRFKRMRVSFDNWKSDYRLVRFLYNGAIRKGTAKLISGPEFSIVNSAPKEMTPEEVEKAKKELDKFNETVGAKPVETNDVHLKLVHFSKSSVISQNRLKKISKSLSVTRTFPNAENEVCPICLENFKENPDSRFDFPTSTKDCKQQKYHWACIAYNLFTNSRCPVTRKHYDSPLGGYGEGSISHHCSHQRYPRFKNSTGCIVVHYRRFRFQGPSFLHVAYLPKTKGGFFLLELLYEAFARRLTFSNDSPMWTFPHVQWDDHEDTYVARTTRNLLSINVDGTFLCPKVCCGSRYTKIEKQVNEENQKMKNDQVSSATLEEESSSSSKRIKNDT